MRSFRERSPLPIGLAGLTAIALAALLAFNLQRFEGGTGYSAAFSEAAGLKTGEEVRIAGVKVGKVTNVDLEGDHVRVDFTSDTPMGDLTRAQIKIKTLLGSHFLALVPAGSHRQPNDQEIPVSRTTAPFDVVPALQAASSQLGQIDTRQLARSMNSLTRTMQGSPENVRRSLEGLQKISRAVASRDDQLNELLKHSANLTGVLASRSGDLAVLVRDAGLLLQEINNRRQVIAQLLTGTVELSQQITGAIQENRAALNPALKNLHRVENILEHNQGNLTKTFQTMAPYFTEAADITGNGRWIDNYIQNLVPVPGTIAPPGAPTTPGQRQQPRQSNPLPIIH
jgi:phospholipid/cholesterol/gamma-HCH transport system substrate-binding protein